MIFIFIITTIIVLVIYLNNYYKEKKEKYFKNKILTNQFSISDGEFLNICRELFFLIDEKYCSIEFKTEEKTSRYYERTDLIIYDLKTKEEIFNIKNYFQEVNNKIQCSNDFNLKQFLNKSTKTGYLKEIL